ncbi:MAG: hypothetical protein ACYDAO_00080 [Thermoplasmataceae archaeon]
MSDIFVRAFADNSSEYKHKEEEYHNHNIRMTIDTETTIDQYQNLTFGSCLIQTKISTGFKEEWYLFYSDIPKDKIDLINVYGREHNIAVMPIRDFVNNVFYPYTYKIRAEIIGFNLPFDLSRLASSYGISRKTKDAFSFKLSEDVRNPRIRIQSIDQKRSFISFTKPLRKKSNRKYRHYSGYFVDLKTLTFALTDKSHSLDSACEDFNVSRKQHTEEHGKITKEYIEYNLNDVRITSKLYESALQRYKMFNLNDPVNRLYSPASIGKAYLRKMGIKSFTECNPDFPKDILGYAMSSYYGGRTEVRIRNKPIPVTYLDFTSMYPTVYSLLELDKFLKAKKIDYIHNTENTENVKAFVNSLKIEDLRNPKTWLRNEMHSIVKIKPNEDILPVRMEYSKLSKNIGINYLTSNKEMWYTIEDIISSKILTGKIPEIVDAITFIQVDKQDNLKDVHISDITISSKEDFIKKVIEERMKIKQSNSVDKEQIQLILKIIANSTSYGIYIEENQESSEDTQDVDIFSVDSFSVHTKKIEKHGLYFNPIMASLITGSARLILSIAEKIAVDKGYFAYCDTDSVFVDTNIEKDIQDFFRLLNPYSIPVEMFKIETDDDKKPLDNVMFYGISAKRYCLYDYKNGEYKIRKYSTHGLGHLKDIDGKQIWKSILTNDLNGYSDRIAISQITITKPSILNRFRKLNANKPLSKQIKPFNFMLIGSEINNVIPCLSYSKDINGIEFRSFTDYRTGMTSKDLPLPSTAYWHTLEDVLTSYVRHDDYKFDYVENRAIRKHLTANRIRYIGKESNNLDESLIFGIDDNSYLEYSNLEEFKDWVLLLKPKDVRDKGISERTLYKIKLKIKQGKQLNPKTKIVKILIELFEQHMKEIKD